MTATFGRLENSSLEPGNGLTVINSPNEGGKSTWCAFIRTMLYGIDTAERERGGIKPDKVKYAPWSGAPMEGRMTLSHEGQSITLIRRSKGALPLREITASYTGSGDPAALNTSAIGEELTGMSKGVFERTVFIRQAGLGISGNPDLEKRISAIVSTGDEESSYTEVDERLRAWQRKLRYNKRGAIPELEVEIAQLNDELSNMHNIKAESIRLTSNISQLEQEAAQLESQVQESRKSHRKAALSRMSESRDALREQESVLDKARAEAAEKLGMLRASAFSEITPDELLSKAELDYEKALNSQQPSLSDVKPTFSIILALAAAAAFITAAFTSYLLIILGAVLSIGTIAAFALYRKSQAAVNSARETLTATLAKYKVSSPEDIMEAVKSHKLVYEQWQSAAQREKNLSVRLDEMRAKQKQLDAEVLSELDFSENGDNETADIGRKLSHVSQELFAAREQSAAARGKLETLGDPLIAKSQLDSMESRLEELNEQYEALTLALETLHGANTEMQTRFSPRLGKRAAELMYRLTGGRYDELTLDRQLTPQARLTGDISTREAAFLSAGALDQLYLALRIAICELALPDDACPMILDDALVNFDDERTVLALNLLLELAKDRQILLFTCHKREVEYLKDNPAVKILSI